MKARFKSVLIICLTIALLSFTCFKTYQIFSYKASNQTYITEHIKLPTMKAQQKLSATQPSQQDFPFALPEAPNSDLIENTYAGYLPKISSDGLTAYRYYAAPFDAKAYRGSIAIAVGPFELTDTTIYPKIDMLPHQVSLILSPYTNNIQKVIDYARQRGHEIYLSVPLESLTFPINDTGPDTLLINYSKKTNLDQLNRILGKGTGYVGLINLDGGRFVSYESQMRFFLTVLDKRGIAFIDASSNLRSLTIALSKQIGGLSSRIKQNNIYDQIIDENTLLTRLNKLSNFAKYNKTAIAIFNAAPITIETLNEWHQSKPDDISFSPLSESFLPKILQD